MNRRQWRSRAFLLALSLLITAIVAGAAVASQLRTARGTHVQPVASACAWPVAVNAVTLSENPQLNVSNPDAATAYWLMPIPVQDGLSVTLSGAYPDSRYMSFAIYDADGAPFTTNGVSSTLTDDRIAPDPGSINPWQQQAPPGGRFTVTLRSDAAPSQVNTLPLAPARTAVGTTDVLFFRVYVPPHGDPGQIPLPAITSTLNGVARQLPACPAESQDQIPASYCAIPWVAKGSPACRAGSSSPSATGGLSATSSAPAKIVPFAKQPTGVGGTPDTDIAYLSATVVPPQSGDVLVIRAKAPTTPTSADPAPWPAPGTDMRYWSLCIDLARPPTPVVANRLPGGTVDYGCRYDSQVTLDQDGSYTFVIGAEAQRAAIERIPGATFLPFAAADPPQAYKLNLRNMLAAPAFAAAIQDVPADGRSASAAAVMRSYYPRAAFCSLATLASSGPTACPGAEQPSFGVASGTSLPGTFPVASGTVILLSWAAFLVVWGVGALSVKRDISGAGSSVRSRWYRLLSRSWLLRLGMAVLSSSWRRVLSSGASAAAPIVQRSSCLSAHSRRRRCSGGSLPRWSCWVSPSPFGRGSPSGATGAHSRR